jgi:integrase
MECIMTEAPATVSLTHFDCETAGPRFVDGDPKPLLMNIGGGLMLQITPSKVDSDCKFSIGRTWLFRYSIDGHERRMGLGPIARLRLEDAQIEARRLQKLVDRKIDPIKQREREAQERQAELDRCEKTFAAVAEEFIVANEPEWTPDYTAQWRRLMRMYANPIIGDVPVADLTKHHVLECIKPDWRIHTATMQKVRVRISTVVAYAVQAGYRTEGLADPGAMSGFTLLLPAPKKLDTRPKNRPALDYTRMAEFLTLVRQTPGSIARALELAVLTAAREGMVRLAVWEEIDWAAGVWQIPLERMKGDREHRVPLSQAALALLRAMKGNNANPTGLIFPGRNSDEAIQKNGLNRVAQEIAAKMGTAAVTAHGTCRACFRTWGGEKTTFQRELLEVALAHSVGDNETERAYQRGDLLEKRAQVMEAWADYCDGAKSDNVVALKLAS